MDLSIVSPVPLPVFEISGDVSSQGQRWKRWLKRFENYVVAVNIMDNKSKKAMLRHYAGEQVHEVFLTLEAGQLASASTLPKAEQSTLMLDEYALAIQLLDSYFRHLKNIDYKAYVFRQAKQTPGETLARFCTRLKHKLLLQ